MNAVTNTIVSGGAAALMVVAQASTANAATAEGFSKAMRAAEVLHGIQLGNGKPSSATPAPTPGPTLTSSPNETSLPLWDTLLPLGQASPNGSATVDGAGPTEGSPATGGTPVGNPSIPVAENLLLIQQLTSRAMPVPALATADGAATDGRGTAPASAAAPVSTSAAGAIVTGPATAGSAIASTTADESTLVAAQALAPSTTAVPARNASVPAGIPATPTEGSAAMTLGALAGAPRAVITPASHHRGASVPQAAAQPAAVVTTTANASATANAPLTVPAPPVSLLPGVPAVAASATARQTADVNAANTANVANTAKNANVGTSQEHPVAALSGPQAAGAAPSSSVSAPAPAAPAPPTPQPLATQVSRPMLQLAAQGNGEHTVTLNVSPDNLGQVTVRAHVGADGIRVDLFAATDSGREALKSILGDLRRDLASTGGNSSLNLSGDGQPGTSGGRGSADRPQQAASDQHIGTMEPEPEPEPDAPRQTNGTTTLDLMA